MKLSFALLLVCSTLGFAAVGPSGGGGTVIPGGSTNVALLNGTNVFTGTNTFNTNLIFGSSTLQTQLDSKPTVALTNVARLDQSQTWTGTPTFPAGVFSANNIGIRKLWSCPTNIYLTSLATTASPTNHGDFANITQLAEVEVPAFLSSNSAFSMSLTFVRTTAQASASFIYLYVGTNTNYIGSVQIGGTTAGVTMEFRPVGVVYWHNVHSFSQQMQAGFNSPAYFNSPSNFVDTSVPFRVYLGAATATGHTNLSVYDITMFESVR